MTDSSATGSDTQRDAWIGPRGKRWARRVLWGVGGLVGTSLLLVGLLLLVLQTEWGATTAAQYLARTYNPFPQTTLTVERASGNWIQSLQLTNVTLSRRDSSSGETLEMAHVDTLGASYGLGALLQGRLHLGMVTLSGPSVTMRQNPDSTWDWNRLLAAAASPDDTTAAMPIRIDSLHLSRGQFAAAFYAEGRDSTARIRDVTVSAARLQVGPTYTGRLDTLGLRGHLPADTTSLRLAASGSLSASQLQLDTLRLTSPRSRLVGHGTAQLPIGRTDSLDNVKMTVRADPLVLGDLTAFAPTLDVDPKEAISLDGRLTGSERRLTLDLDGEFSTGGTVRAHAEATPTATGGGGPNALRYTLDAEVRNLTTSFLGPTDPTVNRVTATINGSLHGPTLQTLDGSVNASVTDTRLYGLETGTMTLASSVREGTAEIDLTGTLNGTSVAARGQARPFDEAPSFDLTTEVRDLSLATVAPDAGLTGRLSGTTRIEGTAVGTEAATYNVTTSLAPSQIGRQAIREGHLSATLRPSHLAFDGTVSFPTGRIEAAGRAELDSSQTFALERGRFVDVNVAALVGDTTDSRMTGRLTAEGRGFDVASMTGRGSLHIETAHYGPHTMNAFATTARLDGGRLTTETSTQLNGGNWSFSASARPFAPTLTAQITEGRFGHVDIGPFLRDTTQSSALDGTFQASVRGSDPASMQLDAGATLDSSRVNQQRIDRASVELSLDNGALESSLSILTPEGSVNGTVRGRPFDASPTYRLTDGTFENVDVGALAGMSGLSTQLSGTASLSAEGRTVAGLSLTSSLTLSSSQVNQASLSEGHVTLDAENGRFGVDGQLALAGGSLRVRGHADSLATTPAYTLRANARSLDVGALAGFDSLRVDLGTADFRADGRGAVFDSLTATTRLHVQSGRIGEYRIDTTLVSGHLDRGLLTVDTLSVASNAIDADGQGQLAIVQGAGVSNFDVRASISNAGPLRRLLDAERLHVQTGTVDVHVYGAPDQQRFDGTATLSGMIYNDYQVGNLDISFNGARGTSQLLERLSVEGEADYLSAAGITASRVRADASYDGSRVDLTSDVQIDPRRRVQITATAQPDESPLTVHLSRFDVRLGPDRWSLLRPTSISINDQYRIDRLLLHSGNQQIAADGIIDPTGTQSLLVTVENVRLGEIAPIAGLTGLGGTMSGNISLTGAATSPQMDGRLALNLQSQGREVGTLDLDVGYEDLTGTLDAQLTHADGSALTASGSIPMDLRLQAPMPVDVSSRPVEITAATEKFPINWVDPFLDPATIRSVTGVLRGNVTVQGTRAKPQLSGTASISDAGAHIPGLETTYHGGSMTLAMDENQIAVQKASIRSSNGGSMQATGVVDLTELTVGEFDLDVQASNFLAIDTRAYRRAVIDGRMSVQGTTRRPAVSGTVEVESGSVYYPEAASESAAAATQVQLSAEDELVLEQRFGIRLTEADTTTFDIYEASTLDLSVDIHRNTWLRSTSNPEMDIQLAGDLDVQKAPRQEPQVFGTINVVEERSTIRQFGQVFQISEGTLTFNGNPYSPYINLTAVYDQRARESQGTEVSITLALSGRPEDLSPSLTSEPPMSTRNILSYLATGRPADELFSGSSEGGGLATQVAIGQASNFVENLAASELGLDVVRLQVRTEGVSYLTVGRYLTPRFYASIEQPVFTSSVQNTSQSTTLIPDVTFEYQLTDYLLLRALSGQQSLQLNLLFEYAY